MVRPVTYVAGHVGNYSRSSQAPPPMTPVPGQCPVLGRPTALVSAPRTRYGEYPCSSPPQRFPSDFTSCYEPLWPLKYLVLPGPTVVVANSVVWAVLSSASPGRTGGKCPTQPWIHGPSAAAFGYALPAPSTCACILRTRELWGIFEGFEEGLDLGKIWVTLQILYSLSCCDVTLPWFPS